MWETTSVWTERRAAGRGSVELPSPGTLNCNFIGAESKGDDLWAKVTSLFEKGVVG